MAKVLVVEQDATVSSVLRAHLLQAEFDVRVAEEASAALLEWTHWQPDVVVP